MMLSLQSEENRERQAEELGRAAEQAEQAARQAEAAANDAAGAAEAARQAADAASAAAEALGATLGIDPFIFRLAIFVLAIFVGYYVVWSVTPALHTPLMSVTNAISSVIVVGALLALLSSGAAVAVAEGMAPGRPGLSRLLGFVAVALASVNIFGGFLVTQRMLSMYKKKER